MADPGRPPRLTYVITSLGLGGAQQQVASLARRFTERGWDVDVVSLLGAAAGATTVALPDEVAVTSLDMTRRRVPDVRGVVRLARHLRARAPDVVHAHMVHANLMARACRPWARMPVLVCTAHSPFEGGRLYDLAYRATDRWCDLTTNVSPQAVARYLATGAVPSPDRIRYVPNGIDVAGYGPRLDPERRALLAELGVAPDRFVWLCAGRLAVEKDLGTLLQALRRTLEHEPRHHVLLAGDGDDRAALEATAAELGVADRVTFLGYRNDVVRLMRAADGYVLSSAWEGLPMVLLEAAACRLPAVTTRVGGTTEIVLDGETGVVVEPRDPEALARGLNELAARSAAERAAMGEAARRHVAEGFDLERVTDLWEELFRTALAARERARGGDRQSRAR